MNCLNCLFPFRMISLKDQVQPTLFNYSRFNKLTNTMYKYVQPSTTGAGHVLRLNLHSVDLALGLQCVFNLSNTFPRLTKCSSNVSLFMIISSKYSKQMSYCNPDKIFSMRRSNELGALVNPKGITLNSNNPLWQVNAVFGLSLGSTSICQ